MLYEGDVSFTFQILLVVSIGKATLGQPQASRRCLRESLLDRAGHGLLALAREHPLHLLADEHAHLAQARDGGTLSPERIRITLWHTHIQHNCKGKNKSG